MPAGEDHRRVEAQDRRAAGDVQHRLDDRLPNHRVQVVELGGVVPRVRRAVIAVIDEALLAARAVPAAEHDCRVRVVPVVILEIDLDARIRRQVGPVEGVRRVRRLGDGQEPLGVLDHPARVDAHVVRDHVGREADAAGPGPVLERPEGGLATEVVGDPVLVDRVGRRDGVAITAPALDLRRCTAALP